MPKNFFTDQQFRRKLSQISVLKTLNKSVITAISCYAQQHYFETNEYLIRHSSTDKNVFFLLKGRLRATISSSRGREIGYKEIRQGDMFGELSAIDDQPRSISIIAIEPSVAAIIKQADFIKLLKTETDFAITVMKHLTAMVRILSDRVFEFGTMSIQERVYIELLRMAQPYINNSSTVEIHPVPTHTQIANMIGANREAVTREMNNVKSSGLIKIKTGRTLVINDLEALEQIVHKILAR